MGDFTGSTKIVFLYKHHNGSEYETKIMHTTCDSNCDEVVRTFMYFLQGVSFNQSTIIDSFTQISYEYTEEKEGDAS